MKTTYKTLIAAVAAASLLTSCVEETFPTSGLIQSQLEGSSKATESIALGMPSMMIECEFISESAYDWGYPSIMHIRDVMTEDMCAPAIGYNWFQTWSSVSAATGDGYLTTQFVWVVFSKQVLSCNLAIKAIDPDTDDPNLRALLGAAYAFRASTYLDWARMYEFMPNQYTSSTAENGKDLTGYTVPIVTENTTEEESRNNPRVYHDDMVKFIEGDLTKAIEYLSTNCGARPAKTLPNLAVANGIMARMKLWDASFQEEVKNDAALAASLYTEAQKYAEDAITAEFTPTTEEEWLSTTDGFNNIETPSWMWGMDYVQENGAVQTALLNWASWLCNETNFGYASAGVWVQMGASLYNSISDRDFRKLTFIAPEGSALASRVEPIDEDFIIDNEVPAYSSLKFRPGSGNMDDYKVACVVGVPLMRVEEMYFIAAEAAAHNDPAAGMTKLNDFMKTYRYPSYRSNATSKNDVIDEIILQKRIEFFGEGLTFFDVKRLNMSVTRYYDGTNFTPGSDTYNTEGRPAWMNFIMVRSEPRNNTAVDGFNNPDVYNTCPVIR